MRTNGQNGDQLVENKNSKLHKLLTLSLIVSVIAATTRAIRTRSKAYSQALARCSAYRRLSGSEVLVMDEATLPYIANTEQFGNC
jgi:hypothetical protein